MPENATVTGSLARLLGREIAVLRGGEEKSTLKQSARISAAAWVRRCCYPLARGVCERATPDCEGARHDSPGISGKRQHR